jgi:SAM-dependent methyltransferase
MPEFIYQAIRGSYFGRRKKWGTLDNYRRIFFEYRDALQTPQSPENGFDGFDGKTVLEIGSGDQIFTALFLLAAGSSRVILADPKLEIFHDRSRVARSISRFRAETPEFSLTDDEVMEQLLCLNDLLMIPDTFNGSVDLILTHTVLEHFDDLNIFFSAVRRLLAPAGISFSVVDLSDHTYHIFRRFWFTRWLAGKSGGCRLDHLRYSNKTFRYLNDPKCFMNRYLLPVYHKKASEYGFRCEITEKIMLDKKVPVHKDITNGVDVVDEKDLLVMVFKMFLRR